MRVPTNSSSESVINQIQKLAARQSELQTQVATGQRIFLPDDDPAAAGRVLTMQSERAQLQQFQRNASTALEISQASFAGLKGIKDISDRAGEIATLGSGTASPDAFRAYASEVNQLLEQALQMGNTKFRNDYLYSGTAVGTAPFTATYTSGQISAVSYAGNTSQASIQLSESSSLAPGTTSATNAGISSFITNLISLRDALQSASPTGVAATRPNLESSENTLVNALAEHGAVELRIEVSKNQQDTRSDNLEKLISSETDIDLPETVVRLSQTSTSYEAALSSATKILQMSLLDYLH